MLNNKPIISFDLDDVIFDHCQRYLEINNQLTQRDVSNADVTDYNILGSLHGYPSYPTQLMIAERLLETCPLMPYAREAFDAAYQNGFAVIIVTARDWHPDGRAVTEARLRQNGIRFDALHLTDPGSHRGKRDVFDIYDNIAYHVDDSLGHVADAARHPNVGTAIMMDRPWNQNIGDDAPPSVRLHSLSQFIDLIAMPEKVRA